MNTLDGVIEALERIVENPTDGDLESEGYYLAKDSLYYLKAYEENGDKMIAEETRMESLALAYIQALANMKDNPPLTWDELRQMTGKPVWIETEANVRSGWYLLRDAFLEDTIYFTDIKRNEAVGLKVDYGKVWQAYRKERYENVG